MNIRWNMQAVFMMGLCAPAYFVVARTEAPSKKSALKRHQKAVAAKFDTLEQFSPFDLLAVSSSVRSLWRDTYEIVNKGLVSPRSHKKLEKMQHAVRDACSAIMIVSRMRHDQRIQNEDVAFGENQKAAVHGLQEAIRRHLRVVKKIHAILAQEPCKSLSCAINREALTRLAEVVQTVLEEAQDILHKVEMVLSYHVE